MNTISISANCTCGAYTEPLPSLHAGDCAVWPLHHNLSATLKPVTVAVTSEGILHVGVWTSVDEHDTEETRARLARGAKQWALAHGFTDQMTSVSEGWQLGNESAYTYSVFALMGR